MRNWGALLRVGVGVLLGSHCALASSSICIHADDNCFAPTSVRVDLTGGDDVILGAQFSLQYDTTALELISISPGRTCDPASPFSLELYSSVSSAQGTVFYAVGLNPLELQSSGGGTRGPAALACLKFRPLRTASTNVCLFNQDPPFTTTLVNSNGQVTQIDDSGTCPGNGPPTYSCAKATVDPTCICDPISEDCAGLNAPCLAGVCNPTTGHCDIVPSDEGMPCDDGLACTTNDVCHNGQCAGSGCRNPSLCISASAGCVHPQPGEVFTLAIRLGESDAVITGAQFSFQYDPSAFELLDISPGMACNSHSPFSQEAFEAVDPINGTIFYAVSIPFGGVGTQGPATMACLQFRVLQETSESVCLFNDLNPRTTALVDDHGQRVTVYNGIDCPNDVFPPLLACSLPCRIIPTTSDWGLVVTALVLLIAAKVGFAVVHSQTTVGSSSSDGTAA